MKLLLTGWSKQFMTLAPLSLKVPYAVIFGLISANVNFASGQCPDIQLIQWSTGLILSHFR